MTAPAGGPCAQLKDVSLRYGKTVALDALSVDLPAGRMVGVLGPDGVGKSSLLSLIAGARKIQSGSVHVLGGDMADARHRERICPLVAYMPQGLGRNLDPALLVEENLQFFGQLFGHGSAERRRRIDALTSATGLSRFRERPAGKLSGGMKQKLALCCALIHDPDLLILDEPTTGVDPLARAQFWDLIDSMRTGRPGMSVIVATASMDEARRFDWLVTMDGGRIRRVHVIPMVRILPVEREVRHTSTAFLRPGAVPFVGEEVLHRREQERPEPPPLGGHPVEGVLLQEPSEERLCQILRILPRMPLPSHVGVERIPIDPTQFTQCAGRVGGRLPACRQHHRPSGRHETVGTTRLRSIRWVHRSILRSSIVTRGAVSESICASGSLPAA